MSQIAPQGGPIRPPAQGRMYTIMRGQAQDAHNVITGTVSLNDHAVYALFDPSTTHSFIAEPFVKLIGLSPELLELVISISTPLKDRVLVALGCFGCKLVIEATRLLDGGCQGYLATVVDMTVDELKLEDISVVQEFSDVFPKDLSGLPPEREIKFVIELEPGTEPNSKAPYRMALYELKELKVKEYQWTRPRLKQ
ncbi:uncharacterized protein LOC120293690 [Eucalyptus grandis]|uniref:uncharacterized protein LOC120293690 n=1 Tax=Eucalyptus grandis TaxID=71139 RepID=UPI00192EB60E|nr:uncharacterized protein LOC120293690 [Eucalyptus grandis]